MSLRVLRDETPVLIHEKVTEVPSDNVITLYLLDELEAWEDFSSFPAYLKFKHQKVLNT